MKICGIICEFNPFHNGHEYLLKRAREMSGCDYLLCVMSGDFTQRGDIAIADKFTRARHAVLGGADCVIELPTAFSVAPAEIFAGGAVKLLSSIPDLSAISFGCETADKNKLLAAAEFDESAQFKEILKSNLEAGNGYIQSYHKAFEACGGDDRIPLQPNNILGVEYLKAIKRSSANIDFFPVQRVGGGYNDDGLKDNFSSASAIRKHFKNPLIKDNIPPYAFEDIQDFTKQREKFEFAVQLILSRTDAKNLKRVFGCGEGLENALKSLQNEPFEKIIDGATCKRYSSSRIRRILLASFLNIFAEDCYEYLINPLYLTPLSVKKSACNDVLSALAKSDFPVITSGSGVLKLDSMAKKCKKCDDFAHEQWCRITGRSTTNRFVTI